MILNDIWSIYMQLIQDTTANTGLSRKINALNVAQRFLVERMQELNKAPDEFLIDPANIANTIDLNYVVLPARFLSLHKVWRRSGTQYVQLGASGIITYEDLLERIGQNFFDTNVTGEPELASVKEPNLYFDKYFNNVFTTDETITGATSGATGTVDSVSGTTLTYTLVSGSFSEGEVIEGSTSGTKATISSVTGTTMTIAITGGTKQIKLSYYRLPVDLELYDELSFTGGLGTFQADEVITGGTSSAVSIIHTVNAASLYIYTASTDGTFSDGETITGGTSGATATVDGTVSKKVQDLEWNVKYRMLLCQAAAVIWFHMKDSNAVEANSSILDNLINMFGVVNRNNEETIWSTV